ncbi:MAG: hypothetical protein P8J17_04330 [Halioglobus sp.]|nr:hypothetical protein [Halioglobus sp.]
MAQKVDITSVKGQDKAPAQKDPHYKKIAKGLAIGLYKPGSGAMSWVARFRHANKYRTKAFSTLGMTYNDAVTAALKFADDVRGGKAPEREERAQTAKGVLTVRQLLTEYIEQPKMEVEKAGRYHEWAYTTGRLAKGYVFPALGDRKIVSLNQEDIENLQFELRRRVTAETVNRGLVPLRAALNYALAKGYVRSAFWKSVPLLEEAEHEDCTSSDHMAPMGPFSKRRFSAACFSSLDC